MLRGSIVPCTSRRSKGSNNMELLGEVGLHGTHTAAADAYDDTDRPRPRLPRGAAGLLRGSIVPCTSRRSKGSNYKVGLHVLFVLGLIP